MMVVLQWILLVKLVTVRPAALSSVIPQVPLNEMRALEELHAVNRGEYWLWDPEIASFGARWNFSTDVVTGEYLHNPCGSNDTLKWQRLVCHADDSSIQKLELQYFNLTGYLPDSVGEFDNLTAFIFEGNNLHGSIPSTIGQMPDLDIISLSFNSITGSFPSSMSQLTKLQQMWITECFLTGTIPPEFGEFIHVQWMHFADNLFTGTIPTSVGKLTNLYAITFDYSLMSGPIPSVLGLLYNKMEYLGVSNSFFSGTIPPELASLETTFYLFLQSNLLTGTIPTALGALKMVDFFGLSNNALTGTIPIELTSLINVGDLYMDANIFSGTVPINFFDNFDVMRVLRLQRNILTGHLTGRFTGFLSSLKNVDFSDNRLSGSIPRDVFALPTIQNIALSLNCFDGSLPDTICHSRNISVVSLDGLGAAQNCKNEVQMPLTGVTVFNTLGGSIPSCVWALPRLQVLHLTGNGLSGSISESIAEAIFLLDLSLSHNKMTGTLPLSMQLRPLSNLDLSHNKFTGVYDEWSEGLGNNAVIKLEVNRLSGRFPSPPNSSGALSRLIALRGNLFSCRNLPDEDEYSEDYTCGSDNLEFSLLAFLLTIGAIFLFGTIVAALTREEVFRVHFLVNLVHLFHYRLIFLHYLEALSTSSNSFYFQNVKRIFLFTQELAVVTKIFVALLGVSLVTCIPIYVVKLQEFFDKDHAYTTHLYQYHWTMSIAYVKGNLPAVLLMLMWMSVLSAMVIFVVKDGPLSRVATTSNRDHITKTMRVTSVAAPDTLSSRLTYTIIFLANALVTVIVNVSYVYSEDQALSSLSHLYIRFAVAAFKVGWNMMIVPQLVKPLKIPSRIVNIELILLVFNNIVTPCIVTALTSPSCFQGLIYPPDSVESQYDYVYCSHTHFNGNATVCQIYGVRTVYVSPMRPPFLYNNLCTSTILTSYIPVYVFVYAIQLLLSVLLVVVLTSVKYDSIPAGLQKGLHGVFWPDHDWVCSRLVPRDMLKATEIISFDILNHLAVFVTFGISSPYLALILIFSVCVKLRMWRVMLGRFVHARTSSSTSMSSSDISGNAHNSDGGGGGGDVMEGLGGDTGVTGGSTENRSALGMLDAACIPILDKLQDNVTPTVASSAVFFACICWDLAGDRTDWIGSIWAPLIVLMFPLLVWWGWFVSYGKVDGIDCMRESPHERSAAAANPLRESVADIEMRVSHGVY